MPERHAEFLEVFVRQVPQYGDIDLVLRKALSILTEDRAFRASRQSAASAALPPLMIGGECLGRVTEGLADKLPAWYTVQWANISDPNFSWNNPLKMMAVGPPNQSVMGSSRISSRAR